MYLIVVHNWKQETSEVAKTIADAMGILAIEAQQKISAGGPAVLASFAEPAQPESLAAKLIEREVSAFVIDPDVVRKEKRPFLVRSFVLEERSLRLESTSGDSCVIDYDVIELFLGAIYSVGQTTTGDTETRRKFSLGKTLLAGGVPMTRKVKKEMPVPEAERDETLWLYAPGHATIIFDRAVLNYTGLGDAIQLTRDLNFSFLKSELRRLATRALYDDRLLRRAAVIRLLGPTLNPETDLDLAFAILSRSLLEQSASD